MIESMLNRLYKSRHFWRHATFGEVADLYVSRALRLAAIYVGAGFSSVYMYELGYDLLFIMSFWALIYLGKIIVSPLAGLWVARFGVAKATLTSNILYIPAMIALGFASQFGLPMLVLFAVFMGFSGTLYEVCYYVGFSIVKNPIHAGKEIGFMNILEKIAMGLSPIIGGAIALEFGPQVTMWVASGLFALSAIPLFKITSTTEQQQPISVRGFPWGMALRSMFAKSAEGFDIVATATVWPLFIAVFLLSGLGDGIYVVIGSLSSASIIVAIATSVLYGKIIDNNKGGILLKIGVRSNSLVHLTRIFASAPLDILGVNVVNEAATTAQNMAFMRGMFDTADNSGHRIMYLVCMAIMDSLGAMFACLVLLACMILIGGINSFRAFFVLAAAAILMVGTARFQLYRK